MNIIRRHPTIWFLVRRTFVALMLLVGVVTIAFTLTMLVPADPVALALGEEAARNPEIVARYRAEHGLDQPVVIRFLIYLGNLVQGDLGISMQTNQPIAQELADAVPATLELAIMTIILSVIFGVGLGIVAAYRRGRASDHALRVLSLAGISVPTFWLALVAYYFLFFQWGLLPGSGRLDPGAFAPPRVTGMYTVDALIAGDVSTFWSALTHLLLPALVLTLYATGLLVRFTRSSVLEVLNQGYVTAARAKGLPRRQVVGRYVLRASLAPILTMTSIVFASLLAGTVLVESVFAWNGLGQYAYNAAGTLNLPAVTGAALVVGVVYISINLVVDLAYGFIDPRVRAA